ncbi:hypothetical protein Ciccas_011463 [Cichlidogyrus casuarinus]|uniref:Sulfatase N-terminal domain-containing protein n=1 Tax=Cichlidogyrus casuarinus TaxID=1844966 RepID=A0ABD2PSF6_9PLAT
MRVNEKQPKFSLTFLADPFHENAAYLSQLDEPVEAYLKEVTADKENNLVIFFSDHGPRQGTARGSLEGKSRERMPVLSIRLPDKLKRMNRFETENLKSNSDKLVTLFDVHVTLKHVILSAKNKYRLLDQEQFTMELTPKRGETLFWPVPVNRSCSDAGIDAHWCNCADLIELKKSQVNGEWPAFVQDIVKAAVKAINRAIPEEFCQELVLDHILQAQLSILNDKMVRFKTSDNHGRNPKFETGNERGQLVNILFSTKAKVTPFLFEITFKIKNYYTDQETLDISAYDYHFTRVDSYEGQVKNCLSPTQYPLLRKFCLCH